MIDSIYLKNKENKKIKNSFLFHLFNKFKSFKYFNIFLTIFLLLTLIIIFQVNNKNFLSIFNIKTILDIVSVLLIIGLGQMSVILTGGIDLSMGSIISLTTVTFVILIQRIGFFGFLIPILLVCIIGIINGFIVTVIKIPSFIGTIGVNGIVLSIALALTKGGQVAVPTNYYSFVEIVNGSLWKFNNLWIITIIIAFIFFVIFNRTVIGRSIYLVGSSEKVAKLSGINVNLAKVLAFIFSSFASGVAGIILACKLYGGYSTIGNSYVLESVAVVVVGGIALSGGVGGVLNVIVGALLIAVIKNGMTVIGINVLAQQIVLGFIIILAVALNLDRSKVSVIK